MTANPDARPRSRGAMRPRFAFIFRPRRGRGECRVPAAPAASRALCSGRTHTSNNEYTGIARHSRTQWFYGVCRALPGDRALLPPSSADRFCLSPVGPTQLRELDTSVGASGPHDFAVRSNISRQHAGDRSRIQEPALRSHRAQNAAASTASRPYVRDDHDTPLLWGGMRKVLDVIWGVRKQKYFCKGGWTPLSTNRPTGKSLEPALLSTPAIAPVRPNRSLVRPELALMWRWETKDPLPSEPRTGYCSLAGGPYTFTAQ